MTVVLRSNKGTSQFELKLEAPAEYAHELVYESTIRIKGEHYDGDHSFPLSTEVDGVWLSGTELVSLRDHMVKWVKQPLDQLIVENLTAEFQLASLQFQSFTIRFGARDNVISEQNPVVSISFLFGKLSGEYYFVTDQTCLTSFSNELSDELNLFV